MKLKKSILILFLLVSLLQFSSLLPVIKVNAATYTDVTVQAAYGMVNNNTLYPDLVILDVREQFEYDVRHLYNATLLPLGEIDARISELQPYNETEILVYCRSGTRSAQASQNLANNHNFTKIFNMLGGINDWISAGYPVWTNENVSGAPTIRFSIVTFTWILIGTISFIVIYIKKRRFT
ncbi:MAG: rhodanese-like domain-containing protein [Promethearchaeota archaeon]|jgi:rhodanese-related sulfurtransferase